MFALSELTRVTRVVPPNTLIEGIRQYDSSDTGHSDNVNIAAEHQEPAEVLSQLDEVSVLHQEPEWFKMGVAEAIHIHLESPSLNRDRGRHHLPAIYREILTSPSRETNTLGYVTERH